VLTLKHQSLAESQSGFQDEQSDVPQWLWSIFQVLLLCSFKFFGEDEENLVGKKIKREVISVRNPQTSEIVPSLAVSPR